MKRNNINKPLIVGGIVAAVLITVTAVIAFRHFRTPSEAILRKDVIQQAPASAVEDKPANINADKRSSADLLANNKTEDALREGLSSDKHGNDSDIYVAAPAGSNNQKNTFREEGKKYYREKRGGDNQNYRRVPAVTQEAHSKVRPAITKNRQDISAFIPPARKSADYIPQNDSSVSRDIENDSLSRNDEDSQMNTRHADYNVSVSRDIISGSFDEGEIDVVLSVYVDANAPAGLIVKENIPRGWDVVESTPAYRDYKASSGEVKWLFVGADVGSMEINYRIVRKESSASGLSFHGSYLYNNPGGDHIAMQIDGANGV